MSNVSLIDGHLDNAEHCVCCDAVIPEDRQYCVICGYKADNGKHKADVVEVVRCKDCKQCELIYPIKEMFKEPEPLYYCCLLDAPTEPNHYCSYGERKEK